MPASLSFPDSSSPRDNSAPATCSRRAGRFPGGPILAAALLALFVSACQADAGVQKEATPEPPRSELEMCRASGGEWIMFNNGCVDMCEYRRGEVTMCTQARKLGCYCKGHRCWNGSRCEDV